MFDWLLEVDEDALGEDRGRIQIVVEYQMNSPSTSSSSLPRQQQQQQRRSRRNRRHRQRAAAAASAGKVSSTLSGRSGSLYRAVENRITAHVDIQRDNTYAIVPVVKVCLRRPPSLCVSVFFVSRSPPSLLPPPRRSCFHRRLLAGLRKNNYSVDFHKIRWKGGMWVKAETVRFWW